ncbi:MAG: serine/threonine protein kinase [Acidobacteria bacterium]|nr:serine/threonine protein kinase [Acidobacteriota bacterium]
MADHPDVASSDPTVARTSAPASGASERFSPGDLLDERYRIVALLGRGGMGEVYRAEDLKLGQQVALKFLPRNTLGSAALERLYGEVRLGRRVSHPNVCRLYDIGEWQGHHFVTMEYIDGEDLASLLRRIGKLPREKAIELARDICAGLAAAHGLGVVHRDLKPANIMVDGRGNAIITDFGLAALATDLEEREELAGTPAYMAPEQLAGQPATTKTDLYALGLVLYEMFTGRRRFEGRSVEEIRGLHRSSDSASISRDTKSIDPVIQQVVMRCIEPKPEDRPSSIHAVIAALPGGDPLQAALEAGETPSPEMVAAAGASGELAPVIGIPLLVLAIGLIVFLVLGESRFEITGVRPFPKHPRVLEHEARQILEATGHSREPADRIWLFVTDDDFFFGWNAENPDVDAATVNPSPIQFVYRESPEELMPLAGWGGDRRAIPHDPPHTEPGMARVYLSPEGLLSNLVVVPSAGMIGQEEQEVDWRMLFDRAGLDFDSATEIPLDRTAPVDTDEKRAWRTSSTNDPTNVVDVVGGSFAGRAVWFEVIPPWRETIGYDRRPSFFTESRIGDVIVTLAIITVVLVGLWVARRNLRRGRGDRTGAVRLATTIFVLLATSSILRADHSISITIEWRLIVDLVALALFRAVVIAVIYLALEPYLRRKWPTLLVSWSRLLAKRFTDPLVGRDVFLGTVASLVASGLYVASRILPGGPLAIESGGYGSTLSSARQALAVLLNIFVSSVLPTLVFAAIMVGIAILFRKRIFGMIGIYLMMMVITLAGGFDGPIQLIASLLINFVAVLILGRLGLLATFVYFSVGGLFAIPMTFDTSRFFFATSMIPVAFILLLLLYGFFVSLGSRSLIPQTDA